MKKRVAVGMSGGVDSSVAAALLVEQGYTVAGVYLECWKEPGCRTEEDRKDALAVALKLKIPFSVLDFRKEYKQKVVEYFYDEYKAGRTPNPDVMCNKEIKFGLFYDWMVKNNFDFVATGHYARVVCHKKPAHPDFLRTDSSPTPAVGDYLHPRPAGFPMNRENQAQQDCGKYFENGVNCFLATAKDAHKDQTYFLYRLRQEQLAHILFPVGGMTKQEVRREARKRGLPVADKPDSQGICFIGEVDIQEFLRKKLPEKKGQVVDTKGNVIGEHDGVWFYTIGQRHGFKVNPTHASMSPLYVIGKNAKTNTLVVGFGPETYRDQFEVSDINWLEEVGSDLQVRIRHGGKLIPAKAIIHNSLFMIHLSEPQRGIAAGQSVVFYKDEVVLGGGIIQ